MPHVRTLGPCNQLSIVLMSSALPEAFLPLGRLSDCAWRKFRVLGHGDAGEFDPCDDRN